MRDEKLLREFIQESLVDASAAFKAKRSSDFKNKVSNVVGSIPGAFQSQAAQEKHVNDQLEATEGIVDRFVSRNRLRLAVPEAFTDEEWGPTGTVFDVVSMPSDSYREQLKKFVMNNSEAFLKAIKSMDAEHALIASEADKLKWPAPWRRYTKHNAFASRLNYFKDVVQRLLK